VRCARTEPGGRAHAQGGNLAGTATTAIAIQRDLHLLAGLAGEVVGVLVLRRRPVVLTVLAEHARRRHTSAMQRLIDSQFAVAVFEFHIH
jgi:hypothetical protein